MKGMIDITPDLRARVDRARVKYHQGYNRMSAATGLDVQILHRLINGVSKTMRADNHQRLCVYLDEVESGLHKPPKRKKAKAQKKDYPLDYLRSRVMWKMYRIIAEQTGVSLSIVQGIMTGKSKSISEAVFIALSKWINDGESERLRLPRDQTKEDKQVSEKIQKNEFAPAFSAALKRRELDYSAAAELIGLSYASIRNYAIGKTIPWGRNLEKIRNALPELKESEE